MTWAEEEFGGADLGDKRLNKRLVLLADRLGEQPSASIPEACRGAAEMHAAYRFLGREAVDWRELMQPHWDASARRMQSHPVVLCIQDTTELDFEGKSAQGLGPLSYEAQRGMYVHPTYAVTPAREPLGVIDAWMWARAFKQGEAPREGIAESLRWLEGYARVAEQAQTLPGTRLVYVADREADIVALMRRARELGEPADWLIRSQHDRSLGKGAPKLSAALAAAPVLGEVQFQMASRQGQAARTVRQQIRVLRQALPDGEGGTVAVSVVLASEVDAPSGVKPVQWRLLSNREVATLDEAVTLIEWYRARWEVELLFHTLKNGCRVEALQLDAYPKLERAIALYLVVAWRIGHLMRLGRTHPELDAGIAFEPDEIRVAYALHGKRPPTKPKVNQVLRLIAMLGGFIGRKGDGEPGVKSIWLGLQKIRTVIQALPFIEAGNAG